MKKRLHLTVHDATPAHEDTLRQIHFTLQDLGVVRYSMLVIPDYHGEWSLDRFPDFCSWLMGLAEVELVLHGYRHEACRPAAGITDRMRSALFTRGEGEFLGLDLDSAEELLLEGRKTLKRVLDLDVKGFVAPAWLYSRGTAAALRKMKFEYSEDRWRIWNPSNGRTLLNMPVANYAGGGNLKRYLASLWVGISGAVSAGSETVRFAIHPCDFENEFARKTVIRRLGILLRCRETICFQDLQHVP